MSVELFFQYIAPEYWVFCSGCSYTKSCPAGLSTIMSGGDAVLACVHRKEFYSLIRDGPKVLVILT